MTPDPSSVKRISSLIENLSSKLCVDDVSSVVTQFVASWMKCAPLAMKIIQGNIKVRDEKETLLDTDPSLALLRAIKLSRSKMMEEITCMESLANHKDVKDLANDHPVQILVHMELPESLIRELSSEHFDEVIDNQCSKYKIKMEELAKNTLELCKGYSNAGPNCWKDSLSGSDVAFDDLYKLGEKTVMPLQGKSIKENTTNYAEAGRWW